MNNMQDRNFDDLAQRFKRNVYGGLKGEVRLQVLQRDFAEFMPFLNRAADGAGPLRILDAGGGQGQFALTLAEQGHDIVLCDISAEMLRLAQVQLAEMEGGGRVELVHSSIQALSGHVRGDFDLVLCHAVLEWVAEPRELLSVLLSLVKPGGYFSLTFYNLHSLIYKNLLRTNFKKIRKRQYRGYRGSLTPTNPLDPQWVYQWLAAEPLEILCCSGIRVFHDYVFAAQDRERDPQGVLEMELQFSRREPYRSLGRYIHVLGKKPLEPQMDTDEHG